MDSKNQTDIADRLRETAERMSACEFKHLLLLAVSEISSTRAKLSAANFRWKDEIPFTMQPFYGVLRDVSAEMESAAQWPAHNSAHESYAVLLEEVDELWEHVKTKQRNRDIAAMRGEAIEVAAAALRFVRDVCDGGRGRA